MQATPIVDSGVIVEIDFCEEVLPVVDLLELLDKTLASQAIKSTQFFSQPGSGLYQPQIRHKAQLPLRRKRGHGVRPARCNGLRNRSIPYRDPAKTFARQGVRFRETADEDALP